MRGEGQRRRGKLRQGRDLHDAGPARLRGCVRQFPRHLSPYFVYYCPLFPEKQSLRNLSARRSPQHVPVTTPGRVGSRCQPAHAIERAATATKHEPGLSPSCRVVSYGSAMDVWALIVSPPACTRRNICRGARWRAAWFRWLTVVISEAAAKHGFSLCSTVHPVQIQNLSVFHATQRTGLTGASLPSRLHKIISTRTSFPARDAIVPLLDWLLACVAHDTCNPEDSDAIGDDASSFVVTQQQWRAFAFA